MTRFARAHIRAYPFAEFESPIRLAHSAIVLIMTEMTTQRSIMCLIEDPIVQLFIMGDNDTRGILNIRAVAQKVVINGVSMKPCT